MEKKHFDQIESEIKKAISKYKWEHVNSFYDSKNFGNWFVEFQNKDFKLRFLNDRGDLRLDAFNGIKWEYAEDFFKLMEIETVWKYLNTSGKEIYQDIFQFTSQVLMHLSAYKNINFEKEIERGRIPVFLERTEIEFLCNEWRKIPTDQLPEQSRKLWGQIVFKAQASLHKQGLEYQPKFPSEEEKYKKKK